MDVSHYAAAFITDAKARFKTQEAGMRKKRADETDEDYLCRYIDFMTDNLDSSLFSEAELNRYAIYLDNAMDLLNKKDPELVTDRSLQALVDLWLKIDKTDRADKWVPLARSCTDKSLICFKICAGYYYRGNDRESFFRLLEEAGKSSLYLDNEALGWIRFFRN